MKRFFQGNLRYLRCYGLLTCQGTLWNQSETMGTLKRLAGMSKTAKKGKHLLFQGDGTFVKVMQEIYGVIDFSHLRVHYETDRRH